MVKASIIEARAKRGGGFQYYDPEFAEQARKLCLLGANVKELADFFNVHPVSIDNWRQRHPAFAQALKDGREMADANVASRLYDRALGSTHPETKVFCNADGMVTEVELVKHYPPDTNAAIQWLRCRQPDRWREKVAEVNPTEDAAKVMAALAAQLPG